MHPHNAVVVLIYFHIFFPRFAAFPVWIVIIAFSIQRLADMFVLGCILLIGMMIGNAYSGGLASIMTVPQ